jgi:hypothetical protein
MKIAYLILAHRNPDLLARVVRALSTEDCTFFIHIDQKTNIHGFSQVRGHNIVWCEKRIPVYWAEFSGVRATLELLRQALSGAEKYDYCVLLQGSDYPLRSGEYVREFFERNRGAEFMNIVRMPSVVAGKPLSRINTLWIESDKPIRRFAVRVLAKVGLARRDYRRYLRNLEPYAGSACWALTRAACEYILQCVTIDRQIEEYFRRTCAPDEMFFQTILGNSEFAPRIRRNLHYEDWSGAGNHPAMLNDRHVALFEGHQNVQCADVYGDGEVLFARKFSDDHLDLVERIDEMIRRKEISSSANRTDRRRNALSSM